MSDPRLRPNTILTNPLLEELARDERLLTRRPRVREVAVAGGAGTSGGGPPDGGGGGPWYPSGHEPEEDDDGPRARAVETFHVVLRVAGADEEQWARALEAVQDQLRGYEDTPSERLGGPFVASTIGGAELLHLVGLDLQRSPEQRILERVWPDFPIEPLLYRSIPAIGATRAPIDSNATGADIVWAVVDSGIDVTHMHFQTYDTLLGDVENWHRDFTGSGSSALVDERGHGTHVAGIIAGALAPVGDSSSGSEVPECVVFGQERLQPGVAGGLAGAARWLGNDKVWVERPGAFAALMRGVAPQCKLVSLKIMTAGHAQPPEVDRSANAIKALQHVLSVNENGIRIHGVNLSLGYEWGPDWPDCGRSPLCEWVDKVSASGVVVVVAAGNTGYGKMRPEERGVRGTYGGLGITINDPGNARCAITVGSTNAIDPPGYGVSYFSSKGPTGDGRLKPDLVAPGDGVASCAASVTVNEIGGRALQHARATYVEMQGTSQAAPHVSGVIAAFLSARPHYIGKPDDIKGIFSATAKSLEREAPFQGYGLVQLQAALEKYP